MTKHHWDWIVLFTLGLAVRLNMPSDSWWVLTLYVTGHTAYALYRVLTASSKTAESSAS